VAQRLYPQRLPVRALETPRDEHVAKRQVWADLELLYRGGHALRARADRFLLPRPRELREVYAARLARFTYQNILGTALAWYESAMFEREPAVNIEPSDEYWVAFLENCDRAGASFTEFFRGVLRDLVLYGVAYVLVDLPRVEGAEILTLADQRAMGALDVYLVRYSPLQVVNWSVAEDGQLDWVIVDTSYEVREPFAEAAAVDRWHVFTRTDYAVYEARRLESGERAREAVLVAAGAHALSGAGRVPMRRGVMPDALWLADRVYLHALAHLNLQNAYYWGLTMGCLPVPVIIGEYSEPPVVSETAYIHLPEPGSRFEYAEPSGRTYEVSAQEIQAIREEMYRQLYLQAQGRSSAATPSAQSGYSKELDMAPARDVLRALGDMLRNHMRVVIEDVAMARGDQVAVDIRGFEFTEGDDPEQIKAAQAALELGIPSATLEREIQKRIARYLLRDANQSVIQAVEAEIDAAPTREERQAAAEEAARRRIAESLSAFAAGVSDQEREPGLSEGGTVAGVPV
jgi:hypothetical protein